MNITEAPSNVSIDMEFPLIGGVPLTRDPCKFEVDQAPLRALAISNRFGLTFAATPRGFCVTKTSDVLQNARLWKKKDEKALTLEEISIVTVSLPGVRILALSENNINLAACVGGQAYLFKVPDLYHKVSTKPLRSHVVSDSQYIKTFIWNTVKDGDYLILTSEGSTFNGNTKCSFNFIRDHVLAVDWSPSGQDVALLKEGNNLEILSSDLEKRISLDLPSQLQMGEEDTVIKNQVDDIRWVQEDCIIIGCVGKNEEGEEIQYAVYAIVSKSGSFSEKHDLKILGFESLFFYIDPEILPPSTGPYFLFDYVDVWKIALVSTRRETNEHIGALGFDIGSGDKVIQFLIDEELFPRIELQANGDDNVLLGLGIDRTSVDYRVEAATSEEAQKRHCWPVLICVTLEGKLVLYSIARRHNESYVSNLVNKPVDVPQPLPKEDAQKDESKDLASTKNLVGEKKRDTVVAKEAVTFPQPLVRDNTLKDELRNLHSTGSLIEGKEKDISMKRISEIPDMLTSTDGGAAKSSEESPVTDLAQTAVNVPQLVMKGNTLNAGSLRDVSMKTVSGVADIQNSTNIDTTKDEGKKGYLDIKSHESSAVKVQSPLGNASLVSDHSESTVSAVRNEMGLVTSKGDNALKVEEVGNVLRQISRADTTPVNNKDVAKQNLEGSSGSLGFLQEGSNLTQATLKTGSCDLVSSTGMPLKKASEMRAQKSVDKPSENKQTFPGISDQSHSVKESSLNAAKGNVEEQIHRNSLPRAPMTSENVRFSPLSSRISSSSFGQPIEPGIHSLGKPNLQESNSFLGSNVHLTSESVTSVKIPSLPSKKLDIPENASANQPVQRSPGFMKPIDTVKKFVEPQRQSPRLTDIEADFAKELEKVRKIASEIDDIMLAIQGEKPGSNTSLTSFKRQLVYEIEDEIRKLSKTCKIFKEKVANDLLNVRNLRDTIMQVDAWRTYMQSIIKQSLDIQYQYLRDCQKLSPELEVKRENIMKADQRLKCEILELEKHLQFLELNKFEELNIGSKGHSRGSQNARQRQSLQGLYNTVNYQITVAQRLAECLSEQMKALNLSSPVEKHGKSKDSVFKLIGLSPEKPIFQSPDTKVQGCQPYQKCLLSPSPGVCKESPVGKLSEANNFQDPDSVRRRRGLTKNAWANVETSKTTVKRASRTALSHYDKESCDTEVKESSGMFQFEKVVTPTVEPLTSDGKTRGLEACKIKADKASSESQSFIKLNQFAQSKEERSKQTVPQSVKERSQVMSDDSVSSRPISSNQQYNTITCVVNAGMGVLKNSCGMSSFPERSNNTGIGKETSSKACSSVPGISSSIQNLPSQKPMTSTTSVSGLRVEQSSPQTSEKQGTSSKMQHEKFEIISSFASSNSKDQTDSSSLVHSASSLSSSPSLGGANSSFSSVFTTPTRSQTSFDSTKISASMSATNSDTVKAAQTGPTMESLFSSSSSLFGSSSSSVSLQQVPLTPSLSHTLSQPSVSQSSLSNLSCSQSSPFSSYFASAKTSLSPSSQFPVSQTSSSQCAASGPSLSNVSGSQGSPISSSSASVMTSLSSPSQVSVSQSSSVQSVKPLFPNISSSTSAPTSSAFQGRTGAATPPFGQVSSAPNVFSNSSQTSFSNSTSSAFGFSQTSQPNHVSSTFGQSSLATPLQSVSSTFPFPTQQTASTSSVVTVANTNEEAMEEETPSQTNTTTTTFGNFNALGLGSSPTAPKANPFGGSLTTGQSASAFTSNVPAGELFRPASFALPVSSSPSQSSSSSFGHFGGISTMSATASAFGQPAQRGPAQKALGTALGSFGQSRQIGFGSGMMTGFGSANVSGTASAGGFAKAAMGGGFAALASGSGFASAATGSGFTGGGFAAAASGGGFAAVATGGGFAAAATGGGFAAAATGGGFAAAATAGHTGAGAGTGFQSFGSSGVASFGQIGSSQTPGAQNVFSQIRK